MISETKAVDWWVLTDALPHTCLDLLNALIPAQPRKIKVYIDHDTPCGCVSSAEVQRALIRFSEKWGCDLKNGEGIACQDMLDTYVKEGQTIVCVSDFPTVYGAVNATAISVSPENWFQSVKLGQICVPKFAEFGVQLDHVSDNIKNLALGILSKYGASLSEKRVVFFGTAVGQLSEEQKRTLATMMSLAQAKAVSFQNKFDGSDFVVALPVDRELVLGPVGIQTVSANKETISVNEVFIGGCTGGSLEDLREAAKILCGKKISHKLRLMIAPVTSQVFCRAADEGLLDIFIDAGAIVMNQGCSVCWGSSQGIIDKEEVLLTTGPRRLLRCYGEEVGTVYSCSVAVAAESAISGTFEH